MTSQDDSKRVFITDIDKLCELTEAGLLWRRPNAGPDYVNSGDDMMWPPYDIRDTEAKSPGKLFEGGAGFYILLED